MSSPPPIFKDRSRLLLKLIVEALYLLIWLAIMLILSLAITNGGKSLLAINFDRIAIGGLIVIFYARVFHLSAGIVASVVYCAFIGQAYGGLATVKFLKDILLCLSLLGSGVVINYCLPYLIHPLIQTWNNSLYLLDSIYLRQLNRGISDLKFILQSSQQRRSLPYSLLFFKYFPLSPVSIQILIQQILDQLPSTSQQIFLRWHSVGWYTWQHLPFKRLDNHLIIATEISPTLGIEAINYVSTTKQRWAAQAAQIELDIRSLERCRTIDDITQLHRDWGESSSSNPVAGIFRIFNRIIRDVRAACDRQSNYNQRLALQAIIDRIDGELVGFNRSGDKYTARFRPVLEQWQKVISDHIAAQRQATELNQEIESPYIIGVPLTTNQRIFTGRQDLGRRLEQLILDTRRPPLLLYGQRRMGKTSLLYNLNRLLPSTIIPLFVDLQGNAAAANDLSGFIYALAKDLHKAAISQRNLPLPPVQPTDFQTDPIIQFNDWLDTLETALGEHIALLALDEFESLDLAFEKNRLDPDDVLGLLRRLIQHRPKFKVLISGSHSLSEFQRWSSYLINAQTVHISYLKADEARQLIERPIPDFPLRYEPDALQQVLHLTHCHPYLIQLLCAEIIAYKNEQDPSERRLATSADVEAAVPLALSSGSAGFFGDLQTNQIDDIGRRILIDLAHQGDGAILSPDCLAQQFTTDITPNLHILLQRELIEEVEDGYRFAIELIRRWFLRAT